MTALRKARTASRGFRAILLLLFFLSLGFAADTSLALDVPPLRGYVNDYAGMISPAAKAKIETELKNFERSDSTQVFVLTIPGLQGEALEDYSIRVAEKWKAGQKGKDNGVLLLVAKADRKIRIEVGRGLEGRLTDLTAGQIVDLVIKPRFSRGDFDGGFIAATSAIIDATRGEFKAQPRKAPVQKKGGSFSPFFALLILGGIALFFIAGISRILGAVAGALGLPALIYFALLPLGIIPLVILALVGLGIGLFLPLLFSGWGHGGGWWFFGGGGPWGGGGDSGGGFDGGGFDGGGGGDFGGGGASGDW